MQSMIKGLIISVLIVLAITVALALRADYPASDLTKDIASIFACSILAIVGVFALFFLFASSVSWILLLFVVCVAFYGVVTIANDLFTAIIAAVLVTLAGMVIVMVVDVDDFNDAAKSKLFFPSLFLSACVCFAILYGIPRLLS